MRKMIGHRPILMYGCKLICTLFAAVMMYKIYEEYISAERNILSEKHSKLGKMAFQQYDNSQIFDNKMNLNEQKINENKMNEMKRKENKLNLNEGKFNFNKEEQSLNVKETNCKIEDKTNRNTEDRINKNDFFGAIRNANKTYTYDLIINTYMRSGSTFLGKLFSIRPDTFYVFEPLWNAQRFAFYRGEKELCHYSENRCARQGKDSVAKEVGKEITWQESLSFLNGLLDCTFVRHETFLPGVKHFPQEYPNMTRNWNFAKGTLWQPYQACATTEKSTYKKCFDLMLPVCKNSKNKVLKVLRTTLDNLESMLKSRPNLKVIHLFRDPRGMVNSHLHTPFYRSKLNNMRDIENDIKTTCWRMGYDLRVSLRLRTRYTDRFRIVQYEDFSDLQNNAKILYKFLGMDTTEEILRDLDKLIKPTDASKGFHPFNYRDTLSWDIERLVFRHCESVIRALGYPTFTTKEEYLSSNNDKELVAKLPYTLN